MTEPIDINAPHLVGKYLELSDDGTELAIPPRDEHLTAAEDTDEELAAEALPEACDVVVTEDGNPTYAWFFLTNRGTTDATVTIERSWTYQNRRRRDTAQHRLYPGQHKNVFNMPRRQDPRCRIIRCR